MIPNYNVLPETSHNLCEIILITVPTAINDQLWAVKEQKVWVCLTNELVEKNSEKEPFAVFWRVCLFDLNNGEK